MREERRDLSSTTIISICDTMRKTRAGLRPLELGPSTHTLRERAIRGLYNDVRVEGVQGSGACGTTLLRTVYQLVKVRQRVI